MPELPLQGRCAIVTGSAKRIGRLIASGLADLGAAVVINARSSKAEADAAAESILARGGRAAVCLADVADPEDARRLVEAAVSSFGRLDILVNNAAIRPASPLDDLSYADWRKVTATILDGAFLMSQAAAPHLRRSGHGRIVNIGGITAHIGARNRPHVVAAKAGVVGLTKALALELAADGVTVNCVAPGLIEDAGDDEAHKASRRRTTPPESIPLQRAGRPDDVAKVVVRLCTDEFGYVTAQTIHVNGGLYSC